MSILRVPSRKPPSPVLASPSTSLSASLSLHVPSQSFLPYPVLRASPSVSRRANHHVPSQPLAPCLVLPASSSTSRPASFSLRVLSYQPLQPSPVPPASISAPTVPEGTATIKSHLELPAPVTATGDIAHLKGRTAIERSAVPPLIVLTAGLVAASPSQPRAVLLFIGAATVILGIYFVVPPKDDGKTYAFMTAFLHRLPDVFTAAGCVLIVLGIGAAFPNEIALVPLFLFISFAALALLFGAILAMWIIAALYGAALFSLAMFVVLAFTV